MRARNIGGSVACLILMVLIFRCEAGIQRIDHQGPFIYGERQTCHINNESAWFPILGSLVYPVVHRCFIDPFCDAIGICNTRQEPDRYIVVLPDSAYLEFVTRGRNIEIDFFRCFVWKDGLPPRQLELAHWLTHLDPSALRAGITILPRFPNNVGLLLGRRCLQSTRSVSKIFSRYDEGFDDKLRPETGIDCGILANRTQAIADVHFETVALPFQRSNRCDSRPFNPRSLIGNHFLQLTAYSGEGPTGKESGQKSGASERSRPPHKQISNVDKTLFFSFGFVAMTFSVYFFKKSIESIFTNGSIDFIYICCALGLVFCAVISLALLGGLIAGPSHARPR